MSSDLVAVWEVPIAGIEHSVEFEHGTATGKRIIRLNGKEILRKDWLFKLIGEETFIIGNYLCTVKIEPCGLFHYSYSLVVDGKSLKTFKENQSKICNTWLVTLWDNIYRVVLEKDTLDVWVNGEKLEIKGEFVEDGTELHFKLGDTPAYIKAVSTYTKKEGIIYTLIVNDDVIQPCA